MVCIIAYNYIGGQWKVAGKWHMPTEGVILSGILKIEIGSFSTYVVGEKVNFKTKK